MKEFEVELLISIPYKTKVKAKSEEDAILLAEDEAMDYLENKASSPRKFDELWEYETEIEVSSIK